MGALQNMAYKIRRRIAARVAAANAPHDMEVEMFLDLPAPTVAPERAVYSDEYVGYWMQIYDVRGLRKLHIRFETFLSCPNEILDAVDRAYTARRLRDYECDKLLPEQVGVLASDLEMDLLPKDVELRGCYRAPMRHHSFATSRALGCGIRREAK